MFRWKNKSIEKLDGQKISKNFTAYAVLLLAMGAMTFFGVCDPSGSRFQGGMSLTGAAAKVGSEEVTALEFRRAYAEVANRYQRQFGDQFNPAMFQLSKMVMNQLVQERVLYNVALNSGIYAGDEEIDKIIADAEVFKDEKGKFSGERFEEYLRNNRYSEASFTNEVRRNLTADKLRRFITDTYGISEKAAEWQYRLNETKYDVDFVKVDSKNIKVDVKPEDVTQFLAGDGKAKVKEYYDRNKKDYDHEKKVHAAHILIAFQGARNATPEAAKRTKEAAKELAQKVATEAKSGDFAALAKKYTDEAAGKDKGGDLGFFTADAMVKEFSDVAFKLNKGQVSDVVESPFGFHIIKVKDIQEAKKTPLESVEKEIATKLLAETHQPKAGEELAKTLASELKAGKSIDGTLKAHNLKWEQTGPFALSAKSIPKIGAEPPVQTAVFTLNSNQRVSNDAVQAGDSWYVLRLKDVKPADLSKLDAKSKEDLVKSTTYAEAYGVYNMLSTYAQKQFEEKGKIWVNAELRDQDLKRQAAESENT